ncbi:hypothetical protein FO519_010002, partial [Halicephalobus sp. NKZ332]
MVFLTLLGQVQINDDSPLNGFADALYSFIATVFILLTNRFPINWDKWGEIILVLASLVQSMFLALFSQTNSVYLMYACYILYRTCYQVMVAIAQWNIAKKMVTESYGLVFGVDYFIALIMQSVLTAIVTDKRGLGMPVRESFLVYASIHAIVALLFFISVIYSLISHCGNKNKVTSTEMASRKTTVKSTQSASKRKLSEPAEKKMSKVQVLSELDIQTTAKQLENIDAHDNIERKESFKSVSLASELDYGTDDDAESDGEKFKNSATMVALFSASF